MPSACQSSYCSAEYVFLDTDTLVGDRCWYWLVDVDQTGLEAVYGPEAFNPGAEAATNWFYLPLVARMSQSAGICCAAGR